jgi:hypothetical protein
MSGYFKMLVFPCTLANDGKGSANVGFESKVAERSATGLISLATKETRLRLYFGSNNDRFVPIAAIYKYNKASTKGGIR